MRRAFVLATDRERLADVVMGGQGFPATGGYLPLGMPGHSPGIGLPYDPDGARRLLSEAGYPGGRDFPKLEASAWDAPFPAPIIEYLGAQWLEVLGVRITWLQEEWSKHLDCVRQKTPRMWLFGWVADYADPDNFLRTGLGSVRPEFQHHTFDRLVEGARRVMDQGERLAMYRQADQILIEEAPILPLLYWRWNLLVKPWVVRYPTAPTGACFWKDVVIEPH